MIQIDDKIVSADILTKKFCCDLTACRGICCVEGNSGAPLELDELELIETELDNYSPYMTAEGLSVVESSGVAVLDMDGDLTTPLVDDAECAYSYAKDGVTLCAIERAFLDGKTTFHKPISCHLYPIRVVKFSNDTFGLHYHRWDVCRPAELLGNKLGTPIYQMLREPIIRKFGEEFYAQLEAAAALIEAQNAEK